MNATTNDIRSAHLAKLSEPSRLVSRENRPDLTKEASMARQLTKSEVEELAESVRRLLAELEAGNLTASTGQMYRLEGALGALEAVLGRAAPEDVTGGD